MTGQDLAALAIAAFALLYLVQRLSGFPRRKRKAPPPPVHLGTRLERGMKAAKQKPSPRGH
jgi:hypothetical protein